MYLVIQKKLKVWSSVLLLSALAINLISCGGSDNTTNEITGEWYQEASIDAGNRNRAVIFSIGDSLYIATGFNGTNNKIFLRDLWVYNASVTTWEKRADMPVEAQARSGAVAFSVNGKGYVGLGYDGTNYLKDFWAYDPQTNSWTRVADFKGAARDGAISFSIDNKGYVGTGADDNLRYKDFYQYDDANDTWIPKPSVPKIERTNAFTFVIEGKAYVGGGISNGALVEDMYEYDPIGGSGGTGIWNAKNDLKDDKIDTDTNDKGYTIGREQATAFVVNGKGYVVCGKRFGAINTENWEYNPSTDTWKKMNAFEGAGRYGAVGFTQGNRGYVGAGTNGTYLNDLWSYDPTVVDVD
jgi:N-acetylneuraminic acid mutarotase